MKRTDKFCVVEWWEKDEGWRPEGYTIHVNEEKAKLFIESEYKEQKKKYKGKVYVHPTNIFSTNIGPRTFSGLVKALEKGEKGDWCGIECEGEYAR